MQTFPRATRHSREYYLCLIKALLPGVAANARHVVIARMLNDAAIPAATGGHWTDQAVTSTLKKLRKKTGPVWHAALELVFDGVLTPTQCRPLLQAL